MLEKYFTSFTSERNNISFPDITRILNVLRFIYVFLCLSYSVGAAQAHETLCERYSVMLVDPLKEPEFRKHLIFHIKSLWDKVVEIPNCEKVSEEKIFYDIDIIIQYRIICLHWFIVLY